MEYVEFLKGLEPVELGLTKTSCTLDRKLFWSSGDEDARRVISSKYTMVVCNDRFFDVDAAFVVALQWTTGDGPVNQPLRIECVFTGHFHAEHPIHEEHARKFAETESWIVFWPFFRQFVSDTTARMAIPPITVPMMLGPGEHAYRRRAIKKPRLRTKSPSKRLKAPAK